MSQIECLSMATPDFSAVLTPNRSLGPRGFLIVMTIICTISFIVGVVFLLLGAWPVMGFFGLDVILIYGAFKLNYRSGRMCEIIEIDANDLKITRISPNGRSKQWLFDRYWVRIEHLPDNEEEYENHPLILKSHGHLLEIAGFLSREEKREFSTVLRAALKT